MKATIPIALQPGTRALRMERVITGECIDAEKMIYVPSGHWRIWLHYPPNLSQGTILRLYDDGRCEQVTLDEDGVESNYIKIKGSDSG